MMNKVIRFCKGYPDLHLDHSLMKNISTCYLIMFSAKERKLPVAAVTIHSAIVEH